MTRQELRAHRLEKGWTLLEAARYLKCSNRHLNRVEKGSAPLRAGLEEMALRVYVEGEGPPEPIWWEPELEEEGVIVHWSEP